MGRTILAMIDLPICIAQASSAYHVAQADIAAIMANGLPSGTVKNNRIGPMGIPVQWLPVFESMGVSSDSVINDPCQNIIAGAWVMAYEAQLKTWEQMAASSRWKSVTMSRSMRQRRQYWAPFVNRAASVTGVPAALIDAVITVESGYKPNAVSGSGAVGMMQLIRGTADLVGVSNRYDPEQNILGGARYLAQLIRQFSGDAGLVLAAYNAGPAAVTRNGYKIPQYKETMAYVPKVLAIYGALLKGT